MNFILPGLSVLTKTTATKNEAAPSYHTIIIIIYIDVARIKIKCYNIDNIGKQKKLFITSYINYVLFKITFCQISFSFNA